MKKFLYISLMFAFALSGATAAQNTDSLFAEITALRNGGEKAPVKCAFGLFAEVKINYSKFTEEQQKTLAEIFSRPTTDVAVPAADGFLLVHYDTAGVNAPTYSVDEVIAALDTVVLVENMIAAFPLPPPDIYGENDPYDIYIQNIGSTYGYTVPEDLIPGTDSLYTSFLVLNSDFDGFYTEGINAAKVTLAHELHHAVQIGRYILRYSDLYFYELTSTSFEEFVFPYVNDYVNYLPEYFYNTSQAFPDYSGYNLAIWNLFLQKKYDYLIIFEQWRNMRTMRAAYAIEKSLNELGSDITKELREFGVWTFFTNFRTQPGKYFDDAALFPLVRPALSFDIPPSSNNEFTLPPLATAYVQTVVESSSRPDTVMFAVVNGDVASLFVSPYDRTVYDITVYDDNSSGSFSIGSSYTYDYASSKPATSGIVEFINNDFPGGSNSEAKIYPQPFIPQKHTQLIIELDEPTSSVEFAVYGVDMSRKVKAEIPVWGEGGEVRIDKNLLNLPSGIYIFTLRYNEKDHKGKFVIINE